MARRKKEPRSAHRESIAAAAQTLFLEKGIRSTSMDDIARSAGYSKATLYVYFENKEEIVGVLVLESMKKLDAYLAAAMEQSGTTQTKYNLICNGLVRYQEEFPLYFKMALEKISINFEGGSFLPSEKEAYLVGEEINRKMKDFFCAGIEQKEIRADLEVIPAIFAFWGMLSGLIQMTANKEDYITKELHISKTEFLKNSFDMLYYSIIYREN